MPPFLVELFQQGEKSFGIGWIAVYAFFPIPGPKSLRENLSEIMIILCKLIYVNDALIIIDEINSAKQVFFYLFLIIAFRTDTIISG
jgi:hypothetical protein